MSRIGKQLIPIVPGVTVEQADRTVTIKGPKGELSHEVPGDLTVTKEGDFLLVAPHEKFEGNPSLRAKALWGLTRTLLANMMQGVVEEYKKVLQIEGVGYRAALDGEDLTLSLGFSHPVHMKKPEGISFSIEKNLITVSGIQKQQVGEVAARIRACRPPEPYKGKGIRYAGEVVRRKIGKKASK
ncbi:MAG: 50S ribosomal protein L6 [bacterium]|nr:50S ribosomal protein L6 [bacterium]